MNAFKRVWLCFLFACSAKAALDDELRDDMVIGMPNHEVYVAANHLASIMEEVRSFDEDGAARDVDCYDLFCGPNAVVAEHFAARGYSVLEYDIKRNVRHNFLSAWGFAYALQYALRIRPGGLMIAGPPCSHFVWLSSSWHQRDESHPEGNVEEPKVIISNIFVLNFLVIATILCMRGVMVLTEQPHSSRMYLNYVFKKFNSVFNMTRHHTWMRAFAHPMPKPSDLRANFKGASSLVRIWSEERQALSKTMGDFAFSPKCKVKVGHRVRNGRKTSEYHEVRSGWVVGTELLKESAEYTSGFAAAILSAWLIGGPHSVPQVSLAKAFEMVGFSDVDELKKYTTLHVKEKPTVKNSPLLRIFNQQIEEKKEEEKQERTVKKQRVS